MNNLNIPYFFTEDLDIHKEKLSKAFSPIFNELSCNIDVSILEGITFASEKTYEEALNNVDRGFQLTSRIVPSQGGGAMTLHVNRNNNLTTHIVFNINMFDQDPLIPLNLGLQAKTTIAHEMTHVEIMKNLNQYEHGMCFVKKFYSIKEAKGFEFSKLCIEEYIACKKSYKYDIEQNLFTAHKYFLNDFLKNLDIYKQNLINSYKKKELKDNDYIIYAYSLYGSILKSLSYYLGSIPEGVDYDDILKNSEFYLYLERFKNSLNNSFIEYPLWKSLHPFKEIQNLLEDILEKETGIFFFKNILGVEMYKIEI